VIGLEIGGGPHPQMLDFVQFDAIDWHDRTGLTYVLGDARYLPFPEGEFQTVFASNLLEHFPEAETTDVLQEWWRVVKRGGTLELVVPDSMGILRDFFTGVDSWDDCAERLRGSRDYPGNEHFQAFTISTFPMVIARAGLLCASETYESSNAGGGVHAVLVKL